ncbi:tRNA pseudouridine(38-40) synthase TruA [Iamia majanohamensis]|uniref:tRNA pseudouridine synthase A n=1 Tax=Iamia majanohamensis TaxID=467976 RepID=A0AAF0BVS5_9ACTN|nr:tRNA pseudouridine(38-40) synthase TruA [Iamia majanohamensis]WCO66639.1 tRNA pseudouridine(38-40) synthase TruA [Iamia majanohamensis]
MTLFDPAEAEAPTGPTRRLRLTVAYDGSGFHGFARNVGVRTVAGTLTEALARHLGHPVDLTCAGRTDRGVHAQGQVVTLDVAADRVTRDDDLTALVRAVNRMCGPEVAVRDPALVGDDVDARFSATARRYRYLVWNHPEPDPFSARTAWHVPRPLSLPALRLGCDPLIGEHDFSTFCRRPKGREVEASLVRRVTEAAWHDDGDGRLRFEVEASAFCHQMVRALVGTLVAVGLGRMAAGEVRAAMDARDRSRAGDLAPPHGLTLWTVRYGDWSSVPDA